MIQQDPENIAQCARVSEKVYNEDATEDKVFTASYSVYRWHKPGDLYIFAFAYTTVAAIN